MTTEERLDRLEEFMGKLIREVRLQAEGSLQLVRQIEIIEAELGKLKQETYA